MNTAWPFSTFYPFDRRICSSFRKRIISECRISLTTYLLRSGAVFLASVELFVEVRLPFLLSNFAHLARAAMNQPDFNIVSNQGYAQIVHHVSLLACVVSATD